MVSWPDGVDLITLDHVPSTMSEAASRAASLTKPTWIMARHQTAARGRRGRAWRNPDGNLAATLVLKPEASPQEAALRAFTASLALYSALADHIAAEKLALKWPNDVLLSGRKVAGILLESAGNAAQVDWLAIGIGVNVASSPDAEDGVAFPPISLAEAGCTDTADALLTRLAHQMQHWEMTLLAQGFAPIREAWLARAAKIGETITARTMQDETTGIFETIDEVGQLVLSGPNGQVVIPAGDVFF